MTKLVACLLFFLGGLFLASDMLAVAKPVSPRDAFYTIRPGDLAGPPGTLIRAEPIKIAFVYRAKAYRILYVSRDIRDSKIAVSGMAVVSTFPRRGARPVVAWAHGTSGVARKCAPSLLSDPLAIPGVKDMIVQGYAVVATDYPGLGVAGEIPYLLGKGEARAVLDSVRAIRHLPEADAGNRFILWGHSQGGHAALFAASLSRSYAPELTLLGVAAAAPATNLSALLDADIDTLAGRILAAMSLRSWSRIFGYSLDGLVNERSLSVIRLIDKNCVDDLGGEIGAVLAEEHLGRHFLNYDPDSRPPWRGLLAANNTANASIRVPAFIAQGLADTLVHPEITANYVEHLCRRNKAVTYLTVPKADHSLIPIKSALQAVAWMEDRFRGAQASGNCRR